MEMTIKKVSNGFIVTTGNDSYIAPTPYQLSELIRKLIDQGIFDSEKGSKKNDLNK